MNFASDNWSGVAPQINQSLMEHSSGSAAAYGDSNLDQKVKQKFSEIFETDLSVFFVGTGTVANSLSLAAMMKPGGIALCHREAHMIEDECGAPELFTGGGRLVPINGEFGKMDMHDLENKIKRFDPNFVHYGQLSAISITQASEVGTVYSIDEIRAIAEMAKSYQTPLHMDGSRFANALVHLDKTPAQMTWKNGVDILSFGGTKNGCWCAEAIIIFNQELATQMAYIHKRAGQLYSKSRFIAAQYDAYLNNDLWLNLARHANDMADKLRVGFNNTQGARLGWDTQSNEVFCVMAQEKADTLRKNNTSFHPWGIPSAMVNKPLKHEDLFRFVTNFSTSDGEIDRLLSLISR